MDTTLNAANPTTSARTVSVVGLGYIGLPTAAMFASRGLRVAGVDINPHAVETINSGRAHIEEGDLDALVERVVADGTLHAYTTPQPADAFVIAVPTPVDHATHAPDVSYIEAVGRSIAPLLQAGNLVILESTSPVGTTDMLSSLLSGLRPDLSFPHQAGDRADVCLAYCPERIIPGRMLKELVENARIIGGMTPRCSEAAAALYRTFVVGDCLLSDAKTAEMVKLAENAYRDVNIAFANELSMLCGDLGIDPWQVIGFANRHPRVSILNPGPGVGGHCIAVDPWFIVASAPQRARLIRTAREVNDAKPGFVLAQVAETLDAFPQAKVACLGLSYKPDVDDFRESPALEIALQLARRYPGRVLASDPFAEALPASLRAQSPGLALLPADAAVDAAEVVLVLVGHMAYRTLAMPTGKSLIDTVGFWR